MAREITLDSIHDDPKAAAAAEAIDWFVEVAGDDAAQSDVEARTEALLELGRAYRALQATTTADGQKLRSQELIMQRHDLDLRRYQEAMKNLDGELQEQRQKTRKALQALEEEKEAPAPLEGTEMAKRLKRVRGHVMDLRDGNVDEEQAAQDIEWLERWIRRSVVNAARQIPKDVDAEIPDEVRDHLAEYTRALYRSLRQNAVVVTAMRMAGGPTEAAGEGTL